MSRGWESGGASRVVEFGSASLFAAAAGYSFSLVSGSPAGTAAAAVAAFVGAWLALKRIDDTPSLKLPAFALAQIQLELRAEAPELLLTELAELLLTDHLNQAPDGADELLLDDRLEPPGEGARVIRLFAPRLPPTAGELNERYIGHLGKGDCSRNHDATGELHQALTALRNSLR